MTNNSLLQGGFANCNSGFFKKKKDNFQDQILNVHFFFSIGGDHHTYRVFSTRLKLQNKIKSFGFCKPKKQI
jgi:hypothetical protein